MLPESVLTKKEKPPTPALRWSPLSITKDATEYKTMEGEYMKRKKTETERRQ
jgi:hypothetical protein